MKPKTFTPVKSVVYNNGSHQPIGCMLNISLLLFNSTKLRIIGDISHDSS